jgi:hypothetical protein
VITLNAFTYIPKGEENTMSEDIKELKIINESTQVSDEEAQKLQEEVNKTLGFKREKIGNPIAKELTLTDGEVDVRQLPDADFKQVIARLNKNVADGMNVIIDQLNYITLVMLESLAPSKKAEVMKRLDAIRVRGEEQAKMQ